MKKLQLTEHRKELLKSLILSLCLYGCAVLLTLYIIEYGISPDIFPVFHRLSDVSAFGNMIAIFLFSGALVCYEHSTKKWLSFFYMVMIIISITAVSVQGNTAVMASILLIPLLVVAFIEPEVRRVKRVLCIFFITAVLFSNMYFIYSFTDLIHTQGVEYFFGSSILGGLITVILAFLMMITFDKDTEDVDDSSTTLYGVRKLCRNIIKICMMIIIVSLLFGWDMGAVRNDLSVVFQKPNGKETEVGMFANVVCRMFCGINKGCAQAISGNVFGVLAAKTGVVGVIIATIVLVYLGYILYRHFAKMDEQGDVWDLITFVGIVQLVILPVCIELIPLWCIFIFVCAARETGWKLHIIRFFKKIDQSQEVNASDEQEMNNSSSID